MTSLLGTTKIAQRLGVSESYARQLCENKTLPAIKLGKLWRIDETVLEEWIKREGEKNTQKLVALTGGRK